MTTAEAEAAFPWLQPYWETYAPFFARPPGGERGRLSVSTVHRVLQRGWRAPSNSSRGSLGHANRIEVPLGEDRKFPSI
jgi:hypothetical protein